MADRVWGWRDVLAKIMGRVDRRPPEADLSVKIARHEIEAEWRWSRNNEENRRRGCPCGRPAQVARPHPEVTGTVPYLWWTCEDHAGAGGFGSWPDPETGEIRTVAIFHHATPCPDGQVMTEGGPIGKPSDHFGCQHRTHEETRR